MLVAVLAGLSLFALLFLVAAHFEERRTGIKLRLEKLRTNKKGGYFSVGGMLGIERSIGGLKEKLALSGSESDPEDLVLWFLLGTVTLSAVAIYYGYALLALLLPGVGVAVGKYLLDTLTSRRTRLLEAQFKDFLMALSLHLAVVHAFQPSFMKAVEKTEKPLRSYLDRAVIGMQSGESTEVALEVVRQIPSVPIASWVDSALFAVRVKADLSAMCTRTAERLALKIKMANRVYAQTAQSKSLMVSMGGVTLFMVVSTMASSPEFVEFYSSPLGRMAATGAILSFVVTTLYILRTIDVEMTK